MVKLNIVVFVRFFVKIGSFVIDFEWRLFFFKEDLSFYMTDIISFIEKFYIDKIVFCF